MYTPHKGMLRIRYGAEGYLMKLETEHETAAESD